MITGRSSSHANRQNSGLSECVQAVDAVYVNGGDAEGNFMVAATARRHNNLVQTILLFRVGD